MNRPLYEVIKKQAHAKLKRFFMPSHAGENISGLYESAKYDFTELDFSDNLLNPTGVIKEAEELLAKSYGAADSLIFTCGATSAIRVGLRTLRDECDSILVDGFSHKSVFEAVRNFSFKADVLHREYDCEGFPLRLTADDVERAFEKKRYDALAVTVPDYFGNVLDLESISEVCRKYGAKLFVDESQGAHFAFSSLLPKAAINFADIAVESLHKTMPVYGGGAVLNVKGDGKTARLYRAKFNTSSPSYIVMASIDFARSFYDDFGEERFKRLKRKVDGIKSVLKDKVRLSDDFSRLVVKANAPDLEKAGFYPEMTWGEYCVFILNFQNEKWLDKLTDRLSMQQTYGKPFDGKTLNELKGFDEVISASGKKEFVDLSRAVGKICAIDIGCYPPGVPVIFEGEKITEEKIEFLKNKNVFNLVNNEICVIIS
ncbi:MAG: aminotransferase class I/II-fold pyridoxal phosphate-dependent enzyme [Christensenellales bacterium]